MKYLLGAIIGILLLSWGFSLCSPAGKNKTGHEYMPDMAHPVSYEANTYSAYSWNHWDKESTFSKAQLSQPRNKVNGTIPRGYMAAYYGQNMQYVLGNNAPNAIRAIPNGEVPFNYANTEEERLRCEKEMARNPFPITNAGMDAAKALYEVQCGICHGKKGDGAGDLVSVPDAKYPVQPKNLVADDMIAALNGRFYFAIMHGKNLMGGYGDKLSFEERWQVIHYIRSLQAKAKGLEYNENRNTLTANGLDRPLNLPAEPGPAKPLDLPKAPMGGKPVKH